MYQRRLLASLYPSKPRQMQTKLVTLNVSLKAAPSQLRKAIAHSERLRSDALRSHIEAALSKQGIPLRWAVTSIDKNDQTARVEAIVTTAS